MVPLKAGQAEICACGIASLFAQEGVFMFADKKWGPMKVYNMFNNIGRNGQTVATAKDANIKTMADLKGKRVTWVKGSPALNGNMAGFLAFGGLTWDDVIKVEVSGYGASANAVINGQADASMGSSVSSIFNKTNASPRGLFFPPMPHNDEAGWKRAIAVAPHFAKAVVTNFVGSSDSNKSFEGMNYPYPIFVTMEKTSEDLSYHLTEAVMENYDQFTGFSLRDVRTSLENQAGRSLPEDFERELRRRDMKAFQRDLRPINGVRDTLSALDLPRCVASSGSCTRAASGLPSWESAGMRKTTCLFGPWTLFVGSSALNSVNVPCPTRSRSAFSW